MVVNGVDGSGGSTVRLDVIGISNSDDDRDVIPSHTQHPDNPHIPLLAQPANIPNSDSSLPGIRITEGVEGVVLASADGTEDNEKEMERQKEDKEKEGQNEETEEKLDDHPVDRGWAWFVLLGCFLNLMLFVGYVKSLSILFVEYLRVFQASATATTLVMGVVAGVFSVSSVFSSHFVLERLGVRKTAFLGAFITTVAMVTAIFAPNIVFLICVHCVLTGVGHSMMLAPGMVSVGRYFRKRRGMAMSIAMSSTSISSGVFPMITRLLLDEYGIRGTMLIFTGFTMNMFVGAALLRPVEFYTKRKQFKSNSADVKESNTTEKRNTSGADVKMNTRIVKNNKNGADVKENHLFRNIVTASSNSEAKKHDDINSNIEDFDWTNEYLSTSAPSERQFSSLNLLPVTRQRTYSNCSRRSHCDKLTQAERSICASNPDFLSVSILDVTKSDHLPEVTLSTWKSKCSCSILDFSLFRKPMFQLYTANAFFAILVNMIPNYLPALAGEKEINKTDAALLLLIMGSLDFFIRLGLGVFVDLKLVKVNRIIAIGLICSGTLCQFTGMYSTYPLMIMFAVCNGLVGGAYHCLMPVLIVDFMGVDLLGKALGFSSMYHGMAVAVTHPIIGGLKDLSGSFTYGYNYIGAGAYMSALMLLFLEPVCRRRQSAQ